jgi:HNH endonuclease
MALSVETKICVDCSIEKPLDEFYRYHSRGGLPYPRCKTCHLSKFTPRQRAIRHGAPLKAKILLGEVEAEEGSKICRTCETRKPLTDFYLEKRYDHHQPDCKQCVSKKRKEKYIPDIRVDMSCLASFSEEMNAIALGEATKTRLKSNSLKYDYLARKLNAFVEHVDYSAVYDRDGGICYLCNSVVDKDESDLDHVVPLSRGGLHSYSNVKLTHSSCNRRKNNKLLSELNLPFEGLETWH